MPAVVSVVGCISSQDLFVQCDGGFRGPTQYTKEISDVKLGFKFGKPLGQDCVAEDFRVFIDKIKSLEKTISVTGADHVSIIHHDKMSPGASLVKLRHVLFRKVSSTYSMLFYTNLSPTEGSW